MELYSNTLKSIRSGNRVSPEEQQSVQHIEMPYGNGFDLLDSRKEITFETVFVTVFDHYTISVLNQSAVYYLLKTISIDKIVNAVNRIRNARSDANYTHRSNVLLGNIRTPVNQKIMLPTMERCEIVTINTILYCEAVDNFTRFYLEGANPLLICKTLSTLKKFQRNISSSESSLLSD